MSGEVWDATRNHLATGCCSRKTCVSVGDPSGHLKWQEVAMHEKVSCAAGVQGCFHLREPLWIVFRQDFRSIGNKHEHMNSVHLTYFRCLHESGWSCANIHGLRWWISIATCLPPICSQVPVQPHILDFICIFSSAPKTTGLIPHKDGVDSAISLHQSVLKSGI